MTVPELADADVHLWLVELRQPEEKLEQWRNILSEDERQRADRFRVPLLRERYLAAHGVLHLLLAAYANMAAGDIAFDISPAGKPSLRSSGRSGDISFNISHSGELALVGVARGRRVGVDLEQIDTERANLDIAERFFAAGEIAYLRTCAPRELPLAFYTCWTRKEAFVKARGDGIAGGLDTFEVSIRPDQPPAVLHQAGGPASWHMHQVAPRPGWLAAAVVDGSPPAWSFRIWP